MPIILKYTAPFVPAILDLRKFSIQVNISICIKFLADLFKPPPIKARLLRICSTSLLKTL